MDENISGQVRLGVSIILVAALVAAVLSLMVTSQSIMGKGVSNLQGGVDQVVLQEFNNYNGRTISGTDVRAAIALYQARDVALIVRTKACVSQTAVGATASEKIWGYNYGAIIDGAKIVNTGSSKLYGILWNGSNAPWIKDEGVSHYRKNRLVSSGIVQTSNDVSFLDLTGTSTYLLSSARFLTELIYDEAGEPSGIVFSQK